MMGVANADLHLLEDIVSAVLRRCAGDSSAWEISRGRTWTYVTPAGAAHRAQGWKLHVSATQLAAPLVLARAAEVLARHRCAFKFASTFDDLAGLLSRDADRGSLGKFITVYPPDDDAAVAIAEDLHTATSGLPGPPILSDRPYRPGSLVHYRYGVFSAPSVLDNDGSYTSRLTAPDGSGVIDQRNAWYSPPEWAPCPFDSGRAPVRAAAPSAVLLADRFVVRRALRHSAKGGVFLAEDRLSGEQVVIKQARPHFGFTLQGQDDRDRLRHEARMLEIFGPLGVTSRKVDLFEQEGNLFLAQEYVEGKPLGSWAVDERREAPGRWQDQALNVVRNLVAVVGAVHDQGYVLRDLTPNNVIVGDDSRCRLIDLETAAVPGTPVAKAHTPGFAPPEQVLAPRHAPAPGIEVDLYALGASVFFLATGCVPVLGHDEPHDARSWDSRVETLVRVTSSGDAVSEVLTTMILNLMREDPARRWDLAQVQKFLDELDTEPRPFAARAGNSRLGVEEQDRLLHDGIAYTLRRMDRTAVDHPDGGGRLWPAPGFGETADPCAVQHGSAGVLTMLSALLDPSCSALPGRAEVAAGLKEAAHWTLRRVRSERHRPSPGLYFGRAGIAWGLHEAGRVLDDDTLRTTGLDLALDLPVTWPNPDVCHGLAGTGFALLHFWHETGDERFRDLAGRCADTLLAAAERTPATVLWPIPQDFPSTLAGLVHYGFAHGVAGIGAFLLAAGTGLGREDCLETAVLGGRTLLEAADHIDGGTWWGTSPGDDGRLPHWCSGSSGIGTFLIRLYLATGEAPLLEAARGAASAVRASRLSAGSVACHGLAGDGQFLLDMADLLGEPVYRHQAEELAACLRARAVLRDGLLVVPDGEGVGISFGWNTGLAGILDFLRRLRRGGARPWMADRLAPAGATA
ncbi:class IV lanthionine synthetase LanL [Planomonospora venezuelensis]|uniref:tRNA A-37 threonylcarbamoyl transferase component Bud32 n=2 Tax=Planomonospora venezuelensis TaxID=1999 RepID=A0A841DF80_PLAVE|nr:class IV lanthionine synthetase LanL [Planomonospora venezuelensis]MBB5968139.1 tRNA A-37 threonylcarbamoyl transferase component Bud32 [Planomonospora venezuelensis]GIN03764.1 serine/threonine protein kinase [Planomonospora venezuelensis]